MKTIDTDIMALDLECISYKACRDESWQLVKVDKVEKEYRAFLQVIRDVPDTQSVAPTLDIDKYWHHHILDTVKYMEDCNRLFGRYIHHFPYSGVFGDDDSIKQKERVKATVRLIQAYIT